MKAIDLDDIRAPQKPPPEIVHIKERFTHVVKRMRQDKSNVLGHATRHWLGFNKAFGGARGELVTVTADTGMGKSTFVRNWLLDTVGQNRPSLLVSLEDSINQVTECLSQMITGKDVMDFDDQDARSVAQQFNEWPLYYLNHQGPLKEDILLDLIDYASEELGTKFIVLDHLDYIDKSWSGRNESYVIGDTMRRLAGKAHENEVCIVLIAHPAKMNVKGNLQREIGLDELKGSSSIKQESDAVFSIYRPDPTVAESFLRFLKIRNHRFSKNIQGKIRFGFSNENLSWWEVTGELEYDRD